MILLYRGKSLASWQIKLATLSPYSHSSWLKTTVSLRNKIRYFSIRSELQKIRDEIINAGCLEAWHWGGVAERGDLIEGHKEGTRIDIYDLPKMDEFKFSLIEDYIRERVGESYWFTGILMARLNRYRNIDPPEGEWFCSHLVESALRFYDFPTVNLRIPAHGVWPGSFERSRATYYRGSIAI